MFSTRWRVPLLAAALVVAAAWSPAPAEARKKAEPAPPFLTEEQVKFLDKTLSKHRSGFEKEASSFLKKLGKSPSPDQTAARERLARWFPELNGAAGQSGAAEDRDITEKAVVRFLEKASGLCAKAAVASKEVGLGATAGWEARRALALDPANRDAGELLGYVELEGRQVHPRVLSQTEVGMVLTDWGWMPEKQAAEETAGKVPEDDGWADETEADRAHAGWSDAREWEFTFVRIRTNLPAKQAAEIGRMVDFLQEVLRSRYCLVEGYQEPKWPLTVNIARTEAEFVEVAKALGNEDPGTPFGFYAPYKKEALVCDATCGPSTEGTVGIARHESAHAFLFQAFPGGAATPSPPYGWMIEGPPAAVYWLDPAHPADGDLARQLESKFGSPRDPRQATWKKVAGGEDELGRLNKIAAYQESVGDLQAYIGGAAFAAWCWNHDRYRDAFACFHVGCQSFQAEAGFFEEVLGPSGPICEEVGIWIRERTGTDE